MEYLSFRMRNEFFETEGTHITDPEPYTRRTPNWGFPIGQGNTVGETQWLAKYARRKEDGTKERYWEGLRRVIEGMYSIQKDHALTYKLPWNEETAHRSAQEAYDALLSPGNGCRLAGVCG